MKTSVGIEEITTVQYTPPTEQDLSVVEDMLDSVRVDDFIREAIIYMSKLISSLVIQICKYNNYGISSNIHIKLLFRSSSSSILNLN